MYVHICVFYLECMNVGHVMYIIYLYIEMYTCYMNVICYVLCIINNK
jgi:hypothetical protein